VSEQRSYWETAAGHARLAQGALPLPESELRFYEEMPERIKLAREFREAHGKSTYVPLSPQEEMQVAREADRRLRGATSRGLSGAGYTDGEARTLARNMELLARAGAAVPPEATGPAELSSAQIEAYRRMDAATRGVVGAT